MNSQPERMAARKGAEDARAGRSMRPDPHWPKDLRAAYRAAFIRNNGSVHS